MENRVARCIVLRDPNQRGPRRRVISFSCGQSIEEGLGRGVPPTKIGPCHPPRILVKREYNKININNFSRKILSKTIELFIEYMINEDRTKKEARCCILRIKTSPSSNTNIKTTPLNQFEPTFIEGGDMREIHDLG